MAKNVTTIPATRNRFTANPINSRKKRRVAGYARVSTDMEDQQTSYAAQCGYYTEYIQSRDDWEFVGLYSDEGASACNTFKREGFNRMIEDALAGRIDLIITKSVSRFARNTVDSLSTIRKLKDNGCECYFEKENIWTFDSKGELLITIMSSLAHGSELPVDECCAYLTNVGLCSKDYLNREVDASLSGGEVKRIEIATLMARDLKLAVYDEPEAGIDLWSFNMLVETFKALSVKKNEGVMIISHQERIMKLADEIIVIADGKIKSQGSKDEILPGIMGEFDAKCEFRGGNGQ